MIDLMKKAVLTGMGAAFLAKEKIDELAKELIDKGKLSEQEGEKLIMEMRQKADESKETLVKQTDKMIEAALGRMQLARISDVESLQAEIAGLRKEIEALRDKQ